MSAPRDIHAYLAEFDDIPGTRVYTAKRARHGYHLNQFAMSLMKSNNRERFKAGERAYLDEWKLTEAQKSAVLARDYNAMLDEGGNIYFLAKLFSTDGKSFQYAAGSMTGMTQDEYAAMMLAGGRSPDGMRSLRAALSMNAEEALQAEIDGSTGDNGIELQDREFIQAIRERREPNSSVAQVLPCYRVLQQIEDQLGRTVAA